MINIVDTLLLAIALSMDAFAVSVCKGLAIGKASKRSCALVGLWFGGFQALMPLVGWLLSNGFSAYIERYSAWVSFGLLALIGANMIREALSKDDEEENASDTLAFMPMLIMAIATSIDALAVGVSFTAQGYTLPMVLVSIALIGVTTFILSFVGVKFGGLGGERYKSKAELAGGAILLLLGVKILLEHFGIL